MHVCQHHCLLVSALRTLPP